MSVIPLFNAQKSHIIYGLIIIALLGFAYGLFTRKPKEIVKTVTETKVVNRDVVKTRTQYIDRVIVKTEKDGTTTSTTEHVVTDGSTVDKTKSQDLFSSKTTISYLSRYSLDVQYPIPLSMVPNIQSIVFNPTQLIITGGYRLFNSPIFVTLGTNVRLDTILVGARIEF